VGKEFWKDIDNFDDIQIARDITIPTCILHGDKDTKIPVSTVRPFYQAIPVKEKKLKIYEGGDHGINDVPRPMREEFLSDVVAWFKKTL
jgi:alpha-beta hydrolase superfamily lysophospholipase